MRNFRALDKLTELACVMTHAVLKTNERLCTVFSDEV